MFETVECAGPQFAVRREPLVDGAQRLRANAVDAPLRVGPRVDEPRLAQHPQVLRHRGLAERERVYEILHRLFPYPKDVEDPAPIRLGEHVEGGRHPSILLSSYIPVKASSVDPTTARA